MNNTDEYPFTEWVLYDGECSLCAGLVRKHIHTLNKRKIGIAPVQSAFAKEKVKEVSDPLKEMLILTDDGSLIGGADAFIYLCRKIWWAYGFYVLAKVPGVRALYRRAYAFIACHRRGRR